MARLARALDELLAVAAPATLLDAGCGEGVLTERWATRLPLSRVVGVDVGEHAEWTRRQAPNLEYRVAPAERLPFAAGEFDVVTGIELLEHVAEPDRALAELTRVARTHVLVSVPREPLWRALNLARGAYLSNLGNTPGHVNHWSRRSFIRMVERHGRVLETRSPLPWTVALLSVA